MKCKKKKNKRNKNNEKIKLEFQKRNFQMQIKKTKI